MTDRICPVCDNANLVETELYRQHIDRCQVCNGIYFDEGELESILNIVSLFNDLELQEQDIDTIPCQEKQRKLRCPVDREVMDKKEIGGQIIDICPACSGIWLDDKEIFALKLAENHINNYIDLYIRLGK